MYCGEGDTRFPGTDTFGGAFGAGNESAIGHGPSVDVKKTARKLSSSQMRNPTSSHQYSITPLTAIKRISHGSRSLIYNPIDAAFKRQFLRFGGIIFIPQLTEPVPYWNLSNSGFSSINDPPTQFQVNSLVIPFDVNYTEWRYVFKLRPTGMPFWIVVRSLKSRLTYLNNRKYILTTDLQLRNMWLKDIIHNAVNNHSIDARDDSMFFSRKSTYNLSRFDVSRC